MAEKWRWIDSGPGDGFSNMALDEALLNLFQSGKPVFRTYSWEPEALSLGRFQNARKSLNLETCARDGITVVRRITGGGIIHHKNELTYSLVCGQEDIASGVSVKESYRILCGFLLKFYRELGLEADFAWKTSVSGTKLGVPSIYCFAGKEEFDITVKGLKIGGNAQRRFKNIIFQHGSIPIRLEPENSLKYLAEKPVDLDNQSASLVDMGATTGIEMLKTLLKKSFFEYFNVQEDSVGLTGEEREEADRLLRDKYSTDRWNLDEIGSLKVLQEPCKA